MLEKLGLITIGQQAAPELVSGAVLFLNRLPRPRRREEEKSLSGRRTTKN